MPFFDFYNRLILQNPRVALAVIAAATILAGFFTLEFELDASGESLVLEHDEGLEYYRRIRERYGSDDFLIITYTPYGDLLSPESLEGLKRLRDRLLQLENVESVNSILDASIVYNAGVRLSELGDKLMTLESPGVDRELARREFLTNPFYRNLLVSGDGGTTALQVIFRRDEKYFDLLKRRNYLREQSEQRRLNEEEKAELERLPEEIAERNSEILARQEKDVDIIRRLMAAERDYARLYLGGIPMITADMIRFIRHDLVVFGAGVLAFLVLILSLFFRRPRWVLLPLTCCAVTGVLVVGYLGMAGWRVTVISSNFLSILLIITLSLTIHLIVRFRDLQIASPGRSHGDLIGDTVCSMAQPCFYTILTTAVAFASLIVSGIRPVIDFGWIMVIGLALAFLVCFLVFPAGLALCRPAALPPPRDFTRAFMQRLARLVLGAPRAIIFTCLLLMIVFGIGIPRLEVENRFIDNFKKSTEIYQGMKVIDRELGGTTPLDVVIDPDREFHELLRELAEEQDDEDELFPGTEAKTIEPSYWLNPAMLRKVRAIHEKLESYPITGKVLSIGTAVDIVEHMNGAPLDEFELALIRKRTPGKIAADLIDPYLSADANQVRFSVRVIESDPSLNRKQLLDSIHAFLTGKMQFEESQVHLTGMLVLYNNMLQSLYQSQILTLGAVFFAIFVTFVVLFRSLSLSLIAIVPNIFPAVLILGMMGWLGIPLDMMTITIAAITIGISVDDTIHYIHRLKRDFPIDGEYEATILRCHGGVGKAMFHTSLAIIFGFAILMLSNFIPTIYFGFMTGFAMLVALAGDLLLLPAIVLLVKPDITSGSAVTVNKTPADG